ncbi:MAG: hypothetical protein ACRBCJ_00240 [Hyphomicrobiaceae bacterium]
MMKRLISRLLRRYIAIADPVVPPCNDDQSDLVAPKNRQPLWSTRAGGDDITRPKSAPHSGAAAHIGRRSGARKKAHPKRRKIFDNSFS